VWGGGGLDVQVYALTDITWPKLCRADCNLSSSTQLYSNHVGVVLTRVDDKCRVRCYTVDQVIDSYPYVLIYKDTCSE
jgi:hypothetical protein